MKLIFEKSASGRKNVMLPPLDVPLYDINSSYLRNTPVSLPEVAETDVSRHYTELAGRTYGVNNGFYPLGSCTMKYNPKINNEMASLEGFSHIHPLQPEYSIQGCLEIFVLLEEYLDEITGMDAFTFQPAAGAHGEFTGLKLIRAYHEANKEYKRNQIIVPDSAHGTNPASAAMAGFDVINIPSTTEGFVDIEALKSVVGENTAGFMLTNPNTVGLFDKNILEITEIIHKAGGLNYYDGANLNPIMGIARPGDMGFDVVHLNLHKTFSTPHGGGGPGGGPVGCKLLLKEYLPAKGIVKNDKNYGFLEELEQSIGSVKDFYGNFLVLVRALTYIVTLGGNGLKNASENAVLNANYMMKQLEDVYEMPFKGPCMHEFVMSLKELKDKTKVSALDVAKALLDYGIHPPTMYFPLIVPEAFMLEPTETESKETMDRVVEIFKEVYEKALTNPSQIQCSPTKTVIGRPDEVMAARNPILKYTKASREDITV